MTSYRIDCSSTTALVVCSSCGWRALAGDRMGARRLAAEHERRAHPGEVTASKALHTARVRDL